MTGARIISGLQPMSRSHARDLMAVTIALAPVALAASREAQAPHMASRIVGSDCLSRIGMNGCAAVDGPRARSIQYSCSEGNVHHEPLLAARSLSSIRWREIVMRTRGADIGGDAPASDCASGPNPQRVGAGLSHGSSHVR